MSSLPVVGVLGSGKDPWERKAVGLGIWLAGIGVHLLTGGGRGVMESVSRGFCSVSHRRGLSIGIIPASAGICRGEFPGPKEGYPNPFVEIPIQTHLHLSGERGTDALSRNHINILSSCVLVALPGGAGTSSEVRLAAETYHTPVIAYVDGPDLIPDLPDAVPRASALEKVQAFVLECIHRKSAADAGDRPVR